MQIHKHRLRQALEARRRELVDAHARLQRSHEENQSFYHIVSHELKTPLTSAREFISIVLEGLAGPIGDQQREYLLIAKDSCDQLTRGINDLLDCARLDTGKLSIVRGRISVEGMVAKATTPLHSQAKQRRLSLTTRLASDLPEVYADESRMVQVITNLLTNALKFTDAGGRIELTAERTADGSQVCISVSDTGRGMEPERLPHIFERLYQVRSSDTAAGGGLGLGLYICRELVRLHGGDITVTSAPGAGSTFRFTVPVNDAGAQEFTNHQERAA
jgi:signal transduction histidine kinase